MTVVIEYNNTREGFDKYELHEKVSKIEEYNDSIFLHYKNSGGKYVEVAEKCEIENIILTKF